MKKLLQFATALLINVAALLGFASTAVHAAPQICGWSGATSSDFSVASNWVNCGGSVPGTGDSLVFAYGLGVTATNVNNDLPAGTVFGNITFGGTPGTTDAPYSLAGNAIGLTTGITDSTGDYEFLNLNIAFTADQTINLTNGSNVFLSGDLSGAGNIFKSGNGALSLSGTNTFSGNLVATGGRVSGTSASALGDTTGTTTINDGADLYIADCSNANITIGENLSLTGASSDPSPALGSPIPKLTVSAGSCGFSGSSQSSFEFYGAPKNTNGTATLTGNVVVGSDITFGAEGATTTLTGNLSGNSAAKIAMVPGFFGSLVLNSTSNTIATTNGTYKALAYTKTLSDSAASNTVFIDGNSTITLDGTRGSVFLSDGATINGTGTTGLLVVGVGATLAPGHSPGCMTVSSLQLTGTYQAEIGGTTACTGYDQVKVTTGGTVDITGSTLSTIQYNGFVPVAGQTFTIIDNQDPSTAVIGTFNGLAEGATATVQGVTYSISYKGGTGNDVVLTVVSVKSVAVAAAVTPKAPNTGLAMVAAHPMLSLLSSVAAALGLLIVARRLQLVAK